MEPIGYVAELMQLSPEMSSVTSAAATTTERFFFTGRALPLLLIIPFQRAQPQLQFEARSPIYYCPTSEYYFLFTTDFTDSSMCSAVSPYLCSNCSALPDTAYLSSRLTNSIGTGLSVVITCATLLPSPP